jgi:hypothetical protein
MSDADLQDRIATLETRSSRFRLATEGADGFHNYFTALLLEEREYFTDLLTHVVANLHRDILSEVKALLDTALAARIKGTHNPRDEYRIGDLVAKDGASFIARKDNPGECPGPGWQLTARQGGRGVAGPKGPPGKDAPVIQKWLVNRGDFTVTPIYSNGLFGPALDLTELFENRP